MDPPRLLHRAGRILFSLLLMALVAPSVRSLPSNVSDATKESNRPSLELSFTNKLVKTEVSSKNQESIVNGSASATSTVGSAVKDKSPVSIRPITKENITKETYTPEVLSTTRAPTPRTSSWLPYYLSSEAIARAAPSLALDPGAIREGDAEPSRGRSGSPRRIDNFPPLQNQPGEEYLDAIIRRTVVPPPPVVATTPATVSITKPTTKRTESLLKDGSVASLAFDSTTVDSEPDIGTAFALSEDFTQGFFPAEEMITDTETTIKISVPMAENTTAPHPGLPTNSTSNSTKAPIASTMHPKEANLLDSTLKHSSALSSVPTSPSPLPSTTTGPNRSALAPAIVTKVSNTTTTIKPAATVPDSPKTQPPPDPPKTQPPPDPPKTQPPPDPPKTQPPPDPPKTQPPPDLPTTRPPLDPPKTQPPPDPSTTRLPPLTTTSTKPATKRPNLRRRLPNFRATSPRPTIRRRLPGPVPTTETAFTQPTTIPVVIPELPIVEEPVEEDPESPPVTPFAPPVEPTTTRREYVMTVPPLLDFDNVARDDVIASDNDQADASLEATHLTSPGHSGGGIIPEGATSAIIISGIIGGCAILFFAVLMVFCMWRQHVSRRPIYPPPESSNSSSTSSTAFHNKLG